MELKAIFFKLIWPLENNRGFFFNLPKELT